MFIEIITIAAIWFLVGAVSGITGFIIFLDSAAHKHKWRPPEFPRLIAAWRCLLGKPTIYRVFIGRTPGGVQTYGPQKGLRFLDCHKEFPDD